uniref:U-box domain-containing protein n=1 Tax=Kalanchoe fedtschenkoi TaxID=63787 RepID=A0A7N0ZS14_KALFE
MHIYNQDRSFFQNRKLPPAMVQPLDTINVQIPYHFRCPISLELMTDPVTVSTGQTYDRASIESWVATGNTTCPVTRQPLNDFTLIPNHTLRRLIQEWCVQNRSFGVERIPTPKQPAEPAAVKTLLSQAAASGSVAFHARLSAVKRLSQLARDSEKNRSVISAFNVREIMLNIVFANVDSANLNSVSNSLSKDSNSSELTHESLALLSMFPLNEQQCGSIASEPNRVEFLTQLLFHPLVEVRVNSAALIETTLVGIRSPELRAQIGNRADMFEGILDILRDSRDYPRAMKIGIKALFALCLSKQTRTRAISAGAVDVLIDRLTDFEKPDAERALATIELLCRIPNGCLAFASHPLTVPLLVKIILKVSERATEYAAGALAALCAAVERCQKEAVKVGVLTQLLLLVQSDCTERAKRKAQMLLKLLRDAWPEETVGNSDDLACSEVLPF